VTSSVALQHDDTSFVGFTDTVHSIATTALREVRAAARPDETPSPYVSLIGAHP
jgi:hypothetical protein